MFYIDGRLYSTLAATMVESGSHLVMVGGHLIIVVDSCVSCNKHVSTHMQSYLQQLASYLHNDIAS